MRPEWIMTAAVFYLYDQNPAPVQESPEKPCGALLSEWAKPFSYTPIPPMCRAGWSLNPWHRYRKPLRYGGQPGCVVYTISYIVLLDAARRAMAAAAGFA